MTYVGKILVIAIMAFSLIFLGISTVVFTTSKNWKDETTKRKAEVNKVKKSLTDAQAQVDAAKKNLEDAQSRRRAGDQDPQRVGIQTLEDQNKRDLDQITAVREQLAVADAERQDGARRGRGHAARRPTLLR